MNYVFVYNKVYFINISPIRQPSRYRADDTRNIPGSKERSVVNMEVGI